MAERDRDTLQERPSEGPNPGGLVMVIDDDASNRDLLTGILQPNGHIVIEARDGQEAVDRLKRNNEPLPDVILLDIMMPRMDGFETCREIKQSPRTTHIPVIMITGLTDRGARLRSIRDGANDYITKPFDAAEVALRVGNAVASKRLFDRVAEENRRIRDLEEIRENLVHMIVHDLRQPLTALSGYIEYLSSSEKYGTTSNVLNSMKDLSAKMSMMIASLLDIQKLEQGRMPLDYSQCDLEQVVRRSIDRLAVPASSNVAFVVDVRPKRLKVVCDQELIGRVVTNLADNATKHAPKNSTVLVRLRSTDGEAEVAVVDSGAGVPKEYQERIFEKFGQVSLFAEGHRFSWGLGLTFCKMAIEAHHGHIGVESDVGSGSTFWFTLPFDTSRDPQRG